MLFNLDLDNLVHSQVVLEVVVIMVLLLVVLLHVFVLLQVVSLVMKDSLQILDMHLQLSLLVDSFHFVQLLRIVCKRLHARRYAQSACDSTQKRAPLTDFAPIGAPKNFLSALLTKFASLLKISKHHNI